MDKHDLIDHLRDLAQLDYDAIQAYDTAIEKIDLGAVRTQLENFRADHARHIVNLTDCIQSLGGDTPELGRDLKGVLIEGMTKLRSVSGTPGALKAMRMNEEITNKTYEKALGLELPPDVRDVVEQNREDERLHLQYIEAAIDAIDAGRPVETIAPAAL